MELSATKKWWIMLALGAMMVMSNADLTIVNLAVPSIAANLQSRLSEMQWVINAYSIMAAIFMIIGGRIGDIYGKHRIFLLGLIIFTGASFLAGLSRTPIELILSRAVQGIGYGITLPIIMAITFSVFDEKDRALAVGIFASISGITQALGPLIGGIILNILTWHWVFLLNVPIGLCSFIIIRILSRHLPSLPLHNKKLDYIDVILFTVGLLSIALFIIEMDHWGFTATRLIISLTVGSAFIFLFLKRALKMENSLIDFSLFKIKPYLIITMIRALCTYCFFSTLFLMPIYLQSTLGYNPLQAGLLLLFLTIFFGGTSLAAGKIFPMIGARNALLFTTLTYIAVFFIFFIATLHHSLPLLLIGFIIAGCGTGFMVISTTTSALSAVPIEKSGAASGLYYTISMLGSSLGVAVSGSLIALLSTNYLQDHLLPYYHFTKAQFHLIKFIAHGMDEPSTLHSYFTPEMGHHLAKVTNKAFVQAFSKTMLANMFVAFIAFMLAIVAVKKQDKDNN